MIELLFLLLPVAAGYGWIMGRNSERSRHRHSHNPSSRSSSYLVSDEYIHEYLKSLKGKATDLDFFCRQLVDTATSLVRQGKVDTAVALVEQAIKDEKISSPDVLCFLAKQYTAMGLLARAENTLLPLLKRSKSRAHAIGPLLRVYQSLKTWTNSLSLFQEHSDDFRSDDLHIVSHHICEYANHEETSAQKSSLLDIALGAAPNNVRAMLEKAQCEIELGHLNIAQELLSAARRTSGLYRILELEKALYHQLNEPDDYLSILIQFTLDKPNLSAILFMLDNYHEQLNIEHIEDILQSCQQASIEKEARQLILRWYIITHFEESHFLRQMVQHDLEKHSAYRCQNCGFSTPSFSWNCPSCNQWDTLHLKLI
ncbi:hypothetical protein [Algicola sagamiensis]|uniref:hypothetical protein n=1 Tax=Algicola sagamiensis TaxID=163869 RepID=UPI000382C316|nr:hypothetical protein [Algicola sagamiensis]